MLMVIAHFHRALTTLFYLLMTLCIAAVLGGIVYLTFWRHEWDLLIYVDAAAVMVGLIFIPLCILGAIGVFKDSRAIWIEDGVVHFHTFGALSEDVPIFSIDKKSVPLETIAAVTSGRPDMPGTKDWVGVYIELKSGKFHKVLTFLLGEKDAVVRARLREALAAAQAKA